MTNATASAPLQLKGFGKPGSRPDILVVSVICVLGLLWAISAAAFSHDLGMSVLAYIFAGAFALGIFAISFAGSKGLLANDDSKYMDGILKAGVFASTFWGVVGMLVGVIIASQLAFPDFLYFKDLKIKLTENKRQEEIKKLKQEIAEGIDVDNNLAKLQTLIAK